MVPESNNANRMLLWDWRMLLPVALFLLLRLPLLVHLPGGQDEQFFAVPGLTVWQEGIPRIPYLPTRRRETLFENADVCLMALPPAYFYVQAPFFGLFPAGYPTARIPSLIGGCLVLALVYQLSRKLGASSRSALAMSMVLAISRPLMFTGLVARPDIGCGVCGLAVATLLLSNSVWSLRRIALVGAICGLGALFHPFALVFGLQALFAVVFSKANWATRLKRLAVLGACSIVVLSLWAPLIIAYPYEFKSQFFANVLDRAGPGLPSRMLWPVASLRHHCQLLWEFAGPWQCGLYGLAALMIVIFFWFSRHRFPNATSHLLWLVSSVYLTAVVAGVHPTKGYWLYPAALVAVYSSLILDDWVRKRWLQAGVFVLAILVSLPGAGLTTTVAYLKNWGDPELHGRKFIQRELESLPKEGLFLADLVYVFDVYLSGRKTLLCQERAQYWGDDPIDYSYLLLTWEGADANWAIQYDARLEETRGSRRLPQTCFLDIYVPAHAKRSDLEPLDASPAK